MATKSTETDTNPNQFEPFKAVAALQRAGFGNMMGMGKAWIEALSDMNAEFIGFLADRIKEDVKTQHQIMHCKDVGELQHIQSEFIQTAIEQYQAETGKLMEMSSTVFSDAMKGSKKS
ncbi:MAG: phasin family protein [Pseudomonadota bacterium]